RVARARLQPERRRARARPGGVGGRGGAAGPPGAGGVRPPPGAPPRHYGLADRGAVAPGYAADLVVVDDLTHFGVEMVFKDGALVARRGQCLAESPAPRFAPENSVHVAPLAEAAFRLSLAGEQAPVIGIVPGQLVTRRLS